MSGRLPEPKRDRISNNEVRRYVQKREVFITHNKTIFSEYNGDLYTVFSYGYHFPMYVYDPKTDMWFGNSDKYSRTTSHHQSCARPTANDDITWMRTQEIGDFVLAGGYIEYTAQRIVGDAHVI